MRLDHNSTIKSSLPDIQNLNWYREAAQANQKLPNYWLFSSLWQCPLIHWNTKLCALCLIYFSMIRVPIHILEMVKQYSPDTNTLTLRYELEVTVFYSPPRVPMDCSWTAHGLLIALMKCSWNAHGMLIECSWNLHGVLMESMSTLICLVKFTL
jgi:hypothetical protein